MGQRLNIEIVSEDGVLANSYYHWSAYTTSAYELTKKIIDTYTHMIEDLPDLELAIHLLESTGAGVNKDEQKRIDEDLSGRFASIPFLPCKDRNEGLLAVTDYGIKETEDWEEGRVTVDLSNKTVCFSVLNFYEKDEYISEYSDYEDWYPSYDNFPVMDSLNLEAIPFGDFHRFGDVLYDKAYSCGFKDSEGMVALWIE